MNPAQRVAIVSSPRSGNTWLRHLLCEGLGFQELAVHNYVDITSLPERCVLQLHWYREPNFQRFLAKNGFQVVVVARHPLDVLISVLHFIRYEPETAQWLGGNCEIPNALLNKAPASDEFLEYALSFGAENLLSVTYQWWHEQAAIKVYYEGLVADAEKETRRIAECLGHPKHQLTDAIRLNPIEKFKALPNRHGWQGRVGLWQELLAADHASQIFRRHHEVFQTLGYDVPQTAVTTEEATKNWDALRR